MWTVMMLSYGDEWLVGSPIDPTRPVRIGCEAGAYALAVSLFNDLDPQRRRSEGLVYIPVALDMIEPSAMKLIPYPRKD